MATDTVTASLTQLATGVQTFLTRRVGHLDDKATPFVSALEEMAIDSYQGWQMQIPFAVGEHFTQITSFSNGYEPFDMTVREVNKRGYDDFAWYGAPIVISFKQKAENMGPDAGIIDLAMSNAESVIPALMRRLERRFWGQASTGFANFNNLNGDDNADGFLESADVGSQTRTVHAISKTTYATYPHGQNLQYDCAGSASANLRNAYEAIETDGKKVGFGDNKDRQIAFHSEAAHKNLRRLLRPHETYTSVGERGRFLNGGDIEMIEGRKIRVASDMPASGSATTAKPWSVCIVNFDCIGFQAFQGDLSDFGLGSGKFWLKKGREQLVSGQPVLFTPVMIGGNLFMVRKNKTLSFAKAGAVIVDANDY